MADLLAGLPIDFSVEVASYSPLLDTRSGKFAAGGTRDAGLMKRKAMHPSVPLLLEMLEEGYTRKTWHGPNLKGSLRGVTAKQAEWRSAPRRHNICELAAHAAYWKYTATRRLRGDAGHSFELTGTNWPHCPQTLDGKGWKQLRRLIEQEHRKLRATVSDLRAGVPEKTVRMIFGVAFHDVYHAGQIQLLKRLYDAAHPRRKRNGGAS